jgi:hypothetical protein
MPRRGKLPRFSLQEAAAPLCDDCLMATRIKATREHGDGRPGDLLDALNDLEF